MKKDPEILIRYLDGSLSSEEATELERRLSTDQALQDRLVRLRAVKQSLGAERADGFGAFFVERTLRALRTQSVSHALSLYDSLQWVFVRTAAAGLVVVMVLSLLNLLDYQGLDVASNWIEAAFGLPSTTVEDAFTLGFI